MIKRMILKRAFSYTALASIIFCICTYIYLRLKLTIGSGELTDTAETLSALIAASFLVLIPYNLYIFLHALKKIRRISRKISIHTFYVFITALSLVTLFSDIAFLSDIGKEYDMWDIGGQWDMLMVLTVFQAVVILISVFVLNREPSHVKNESSNDTMFIAAHQSGLMCGITGMLLVISVLSKIWDVPGKYLPHLAVILSCLSIFPLVAILVYWLYIRRRYRPIGIMDEKQLKDLGMSSSVTLLAVISLIVLYAFLDIFDVFKNSGSIYLSIIFFISLVIFSSVILAKNREAFEET